VIYRVLRGQVLPEIPRHFVVLPGAGERMVQLLTTAYPDWTRERALALPESLESKRLPEAHVALSDAIPPARDQERAAPSAPAGGAFAADYYCYHGQTRTWLEEAGFAAIGEGGDRRAVPSRFQPLDGKGGGILSAVFVPEGSPAVTASADCLWYWTRSDSDQD